MKKDSFNNISPYTKKNTKNGRRNQKLSVERRIFLKGYMKGKEWTNEDDEKYFGGD